MSLDKSYEELTNEEADFIILLYEVVSKLVRAGRNVTLVALGVELDIRPSELKDYLMEIIMIQEKIEEDLKIQQGGDRKRS